MASRRCTLCGISYPDIEQFVKCPIHGELTERFRADPDENWEFQFRLLQNKLKQAQELQRTIPLIRGIEPYEEAGLAWVNQRDLYDAGARLSSVGPGFHLFELEDGFIYETQGWDNPRRRWWVERVVESAEEESQPTTLAVVPSSTESATS